MKFGADTAPFDTEHMMTHPSNQHPAVRITDWRATVFHLVERWGAQNRMPTHYEWGEWTKAVYEAAQDRARSGWSGHDPIYEQGYAAGFDDATAQAEEDEAHNPAGDYPYA